MWIGLTKRKPFPAPFRLLCFLRWPHKELPSSQNDLCRGKFSVSLAHCLKSPAQCFPATLTPSSPHSLRERERKRETNRQRGRERLCHVSLFFFEYLPGIILFLLWFPRKARFYRQVLIFQLMFLSRTLQTGTCIRTLKNKLTKIRPGWTFFSVRSC